MKALTSLFLVSLLLNSLAIFAQDPILDRFGNLLVLLDGQSIAQQQEAIDSALAFNAKSGNKAIIVFFGGRYTQGLQAMLGEAKLIYSGDLSSDYNLASGCIARSGLAVHYVYVPNQGSPNIRPANKKLCVWPEARVNKILNRLVISHKKTDILKKLAANFDEIDGCLQGGKLKEASNIIKVSKKLLLSLLNSFYETQDINGARLLVEILRMELDRVSP